MRHRDRSVSCKEAVISALANFSKVLVCLGDCGPPQLEAPLAEEQSQQDGNKHKKSAKRDQKPDPAGNAAVTLNFGPACVALLVKANPVSLAPRAILKRLAVFAILRVNASLTLLILFIIAASDNLTAAVSGQLRTICGIQKKVNNFEHKNKKKGTLA